jgi:hypothetical protein
MKTLKFLMVLCAFILAAPVNVNAQPPEREVMEWSTGDFVVPCLGVVTIYATTTSMFYGKEIGYVWIETLDAVMYDQSGNVYTATEHLSLGEHFTKNYNGRLLDHFSFRDSNGKLVGSFFYKGHFTLNANGEPTAAVDSYEFKCY